MKYAPAVDQYIAKWPEETRILLETIRQALLERAGVTESLKWTVPFYSYHGLLCYCTAKPTHVVLGFCEGASLSDAYGVLEGKDRKQVRHIIIRQPEDVYSEGVQAMLQEAMLWNERK